MASPVKQIKRESETVHGYLHALSPVKTSQRGNRYFDGTVQTGQSEFHRLVCFSTDKRNTCVVAADNHQPVKLVNIGRSVSFGNPGEYDVIISQSSRVEGSEELSFLRREPPCAGTMTIADVLKMGPRQQVGVIEAKLVQAIDSKVIPLNGQPCELKTFEVCDPTGQTALAVWDRHIISMKEGGSYRFATVATRKEGDRTTLTTTPYTVITTIGEVGQPESLTSMPVSAGQDVRGPVTGVKVQATLRCRQCHAAQETVAPRAPTHRCDRCALLQCTNAYNITCSGLLLVIGGDGQERTMTLSNSSVFRYVRDNHLSSIAHDGQALEEDIMSASELHVTVNEDGLVAQFIKDEPAKQPKQSDERHDVDANLLEHLIIQSADFE